MIPMECKIIIFSIYFLVLTTSKEKKITMILSKSKSYSIQKWHSLYVHSKYLVTLKSIAPQLRAFGWFIGNDCYLLFAHAMVGKQKMYDTSVSKSNQFLSLIWHHYWLWKIFIAGWFIISTNVKTNYYIGESDTLEDII